MAYVYIQMNSFDLRCEDVTFVYVYICMSACICVSMWSVFLHANEKLVVIYLDVHACVFVCLCLCVCVLSVFSIHVLHIQVRMCAHIPGTYECLKSNYVQKYYIYTRMHCRNIFIL